MAVEPQRVPLRLADGSDLSRTASSYLDAGIEAAYQPIVHLGSGSVIAYEALARPRHSDASSPMHFFSVLEDGGQRLAGERMAFRSAMEGVGPSFPRVKLFVNASPTTLVDPDFDVMEFVQLAEAHGISVSDLVVEVTESEAVHDIATLASRTEQLRRLGIGLAVDDAGAGHASFRVITRLRPSYIKLDRDLVSKVDSDGARHAFIEAMVRFSRQIGSRLIAEGVETEAELSCLAGLGVEAGQGYFIARPQIGSFPKPSPEARRLIATSAQRPRLGGARLTAAELARPAVVVDRQITVAEAYARFLADPGVGVLVVVDDRRVNAQITRQSVERVLSSPGSWERFADGLAIEFADHHPLTLNSGLDILEVGAILASRTRHQVADDLVVTDALGGLVGVLTVQDLVRTLTELRRRSDQDLNPVSGLLGPAWFEDELSRRLEAGERLTALLVDVDRFRRLNDIGGFALGDDVIRLLAACLGGVVAGVPGAAVSHVGADDFIIVVPPQHYEGIVSGFVRAFETELMPFVRLELGLRATHEVENEVWLSMASVDLEGRAPAGHSHLEWALDDLSPLIAMAKQHGEHSCVRRSGDTVETTTWSAASPSERHIAIGQADPRVVAALWASLSLSWSEWRGGDGVTMGGFPGPVAVLDDLDERFLAPLRRAADEAVAAGETTMTVELRGQERELLAFLDRLALVTRQGHARDGTVGPDQTLLDWLCRQRSRVLLREDRVGRIASGLRR